ncbi:MAG: phosphopantothenoylcysteine decarboxylase [Planctomycetes bacterium]|nr:phosphopantothenoylcysteine decarboxylase [Planctomycetota bacterium]
MRILVTAGPTREYFDSVRFISNASSGKMGYAIATQAARRGHRVVLVSGPVELPKPDGLDVIHVVSAREMFDVVTSLFPECHAVVMTAAVCDYRPARSLGHKLKKQNRVRAIHLQPTQDVLTHIGRIKGHRVVIGFAMEDHDHRAHAEAKLVRKRCDAIVLNGPENVAADRATVEVLTGDGVWSPPMTGSKAQLADRLVGLTERLHRSRPAAG